MLFCIFGTGKKTFHEKTKTNKALVRLSILFTFLPYGFMFLITPRPKSFPKIAGHCSYSTRTKRICRVLFSVED